MMDVHDSKTQCVLIMDQIWHANLSNKKTVEHGKEASLSNMVRKPACQIWYGSQPVKYGMEASLSNRV